jgi:hypothetical protein
MYVSIPFIIVLFIICPQLVIFSFLVYLAFLILPAILTLLYWVLLELNFDYVLLFAIAFCIVHLLSAYKASKGIKVIKQEEGNQSFNEIEIQCSVQRQAEIDRKYSTTVYKFVFDLYKKETRDTSSLNFVNSDYYDNRFKIYEILNSDPRAQVT